MVFKAKGRKRKKTTQKAKFEPPKRSMIFFVFGNVRRGKSPLFFDSKHTYLLRYCNVSVSISVSVSVYAGFSADFPQDCPRFVLVTVHVTFRGTKL